MTNDGGVEPRPLRDLVGEIIGADEEQQARVGHPEPPLPPLDPAVRIVLWLLFLFGLGQAVYQMVAGHTAAAVGAFVGAGVAATVRWGVIDAVRRSRWSNPEVRNRYLDTQARIAAAGGRRRSGK
jgi:hypothetical protein